MQDIAQETAKALAVDHPQVPVKERYGPRLTAEEYRQLRSVEDADQQGDGGAGASSATGSASRGATAEEVRQLLDLSDDDLDMADEAEGKSAVPAGAAQPASAPLAEGSRPQSVSSAAVVATASAPSAGVSTTAPGAPSVSAPATSTSAASAGTEVSGADSAPPQRDVEEGEVDEPMRAAGSRGVVTKTEPMVVINSSTASEERAARAVAVRAQRDKMPWLPERTLMKKWRGGDYGGGICALYDTSPIDTTVNALYGIEPDQRRRVLITWFRQMRFFDRKNKGGNPGAVGPTDLQKSWNDFIVNFNANPVGWLDRMYKIRDRFEANTSTGMMMALHRQCKEEGVGCGVRVEFGCPVCPEDGIRQPPDVLVYGTQGYKKLSPDVQDMMQALSDKMYAKYLKSQAASTATHSSGGYPGRPATGTPSALKYRRTGDSHASGRDTGSAHYAAGDPQSPRRSSGRHPLSLPAAAAAVGAHADPGVVRLSNLQAESIARLRLENDLAAVKYDLVKAVHQLGELTHPVSPEAGERLQAYPG